MSDLDKRLAAKDEFTPDSGFNLVGMDDFEDPGDELYLVGNFPSKNAAELARDVRLKDDPNEKLFIYGPREG